MDILRTLHTGIRFPSWNFNRKRWPISMYSMHWNIATYRWNRISTLKNGFSFYFFFLLVCDRQSIQVVVPSHDLRTTQYEKPKGAPFVFFLLLTHFWLDEKRRNLNMNLQKICWHIVHRFFLGTLSPRLQYHGIRIKFIIAIIWYIWIDEPESTSWHIYYFFSEWIMQ